MNFYKFSKISILLITGILLACSPNKQETTNKENAAKDTYSGLKAYRDPVTSKILDKPPAGYVPPQNSKSSKPREESEPENRVTTNSQGIQIIKMPSP